jgi:SAM-dependent methyltransferase
MAGPARYEGAVVTGATEVGLPPVEILRCPATAEPLDWTGSTLRNVSRDRVYDIIDGVPILLAGERSVFDTGATGVVVARESAPRRLRAVVRRGLTGNGVSRQKLEQLIALLPSARQANGARCRVLVVGGGILGFGMEALVDCPSIELVETDVYVGPRTRLVCDAHDLPFADGAFDAVVVQAVLEHVVDPARVVAEVHRVLAEDGLVYSEVPFMQQVHEGAHDFNRWTLTGHRRLLRDFSEIEAGPLGGTGEALAWSIRYFMLSLTGDSGTARRLVSVLATAATLPLRWLDRVVRDRPATVDGASGTYLLGRRRETPRSDVEILAGHLGAIATPTR